MSTPTAPTRPIEPDRPPTDVTESQGPQEGVPRPGRLRRAVRRWAPPGGARRWRTAGGDLWTEAAVRAQLLGDAVPLKLWGWIGPLLATAVGGFVRFWHLGKPHQLIFDEVYYVKEAVSFLQVGYELRIDPLTAPDKKPDQFTLGTWNVFTHSADFVVHPPVGKWMIAAGIKIFGPTNAFGWRFAVALCGTLSILMLGRIAYRLFRSALLGTVAATLLAVDGTHFVHSRTGILDLFIMFWALAAFGLLLIDRDHMRARLARRLAGLPAPRGFGPGLGLRPLRWLAGVCLGLCAGVKWSGLYFLVAFGLLTVLWDLGARRAVGSRFAAPVTLVRDAVPAGLTMVTAAVGTYIASWAGWFHSVDAYDRQWARTHPSAHFAWVPDALRSLWHYHREMWDFNINLTSHHDYMSNPWSWLIMGRPTAFYWTNAPQDTHGCRVAECARAIHDLGNPIIWWTGLVGLLVVLVAWALRRDWRAGAILAGYVGGYLPWFMYQSRTIFTFYAVAFVPWVVLTVTYCIGLILGPEDASETRRILGSWGAGAIVISAVLVFWFFYPVLSARMISRGEWDLRMWLPSWI